MGDSKVHNRFLQYRAMVDMAMTNATGDETKSVNNWT